MPALHREVSELRERSSFYFTHPLTHKSELLPLPWQCDTWLKSCPCATGAWPLACSAVLLLPLRQKPWLLRVVGLVLLLNRSAGPNSWQPSPTWELCDERPYYGRLQCIFLSVLLGTACSRWRLAGCYC